MSQIAIRLIFLGAVIIAAAGCSSSNQQVGFDPNTGAHVATFSVANDPTVHGASFRENPNRCTECHGTDLRGGISKVSCFSADFKGMQCHANGPSNHPVGWADPGSHGAAAKEAPAASTGLALCATCHGANYAGGLAASCLNTAGCHGANVSAPHAVPWITGTRTHTTTNGGNAPSCGICHSNGANSPVPPPSPAPPGTAPGCFNNTLCHANITGACGTCHSIPPNGAVFPNTAGRHTVHTALTNVGTDCTVCHTGAGSGTALHNNGTPEVSLSVTYRAESGAASFNATANTCSNVSCHGGQTTPNWLTGTINVNTQCAACHSSGTAQYNSYNSGEHTKHVSGEGIACTVCHDTAELAPVHFNDLNTTGMSQAGLTINNALQYNGNTCNPSAGGLTGCHNQKSW